MQRPMNLLVVSTLLILLVGPCFGPVAKYLASHLALRVATGWLTLVFFLPLGLVLVITFRLMKQHGQALADLGWRQPSSWLALVLGTLMGILWGAFGVLGFLQFDPTADPFEFSLFRIFTALAGAVLAIGEDLITRGYVMNELRRLAIPTWGQMVLSSLLFALYHSLWSVNLPAFVASFVYGVILSGFFVFGKRSLTPVFLAHSLAPLLGEPFLSMSLILVAQQS